MCTAAEKDELSTEGCSGFTLRTVKMTTSTSVSSSSSSSSSSVIASTSVTDSAVVKLTMVALVLVVWSVFSQLACVAALGTEGEKLTVTRAELWTDGQTVQGVGVVLVGVVDDGGQTLHAAPASFNNFEVEDGRVACRQFGFPVTSPEVFQGNYFGRVGLVELNCTGTESSLLQCEAVFKSCCPPAAVNCTEPVTTTTLQTSSSTLPQQTSTLQSSTSETSTSDATENKPDDSVPVYVPILATCLGLVVTVTIGFILYKVCSSTNRTSASPHQS